METVGDHDHRHSFLGQLAHHPQDFVAQFRVQRAGRFVEEHHLRLHGQGAGDGHALLLSAGKLRRISVRLVFQADLGEQQTRAPPPPAAARLSPPWAGA
jgi:hypothetical protein